LTKKLDNLSSDIIEYLEKNEPYMVRWVDIAKSLWASYKFQYKDEKSFGVVLSRKLNALLGEGLIKKEDVWYGTPNSKPLGQKPSKLNVWEYRKWKQQYEDERLDESIQQLLEERRQIRRLMGLKE